MAGPDKYASDMTAREKDDTLLFVNLRRFGGDNVYLYSEEVKTYHNSYLLGISNDNALGLKTVPKNIAVIDAVAVRRIPYAHWAMVGAHAPFLNAHINVANIFSGNLESMNLSDIESSKVGIRSGTTDDTFTNLVKDFPDYAKQMSAAARLAAKALGSDGFIAAMEKSRAEFKNYDFAVNRFAAYIALAIFLVFLGVALFLTARHFEKKYPFVPPTVKVKIPVFGSEYEAKTDDKSGDKPDIFG
jgi:hypothetical protein